MARRRAREWVKTTIAEPFPVFYSHVSYPSERRPETARGPFYAAGSVTWEVASATALSHANWRAAYLRKEGWTVTVEIVTRP